MLASPFPVLLCSLVLLSLPASLISADVEAGWSNWLEWTSCSVTCGYGTYYRQTYWINEQGQKTNVTYKENAACYLDVKCPVNGNWTMWSPWSFCTSNCGDGTWTRTRSCANPTPVNGGMDCVGPATESDVCNIEPCPTIPPDFNLADCTEEDFMCDSKLQCVPFHKRCDKKLQCHDGSDEKLCTFPNSQNSIYQVSSMVILLCLLHYRFATRS